MGSIVRSFSSFLSCFHQQRGGHTVWQGHLAKQCVVFCVCVFRYKKPHQCLPKHFLGESGTEDIDDVFVPNKGNELSTLSYTRNQTAHCVMEYISIDREDRFMDG